MPAPDFQTEFVSDQSVEPIKALAHIGGYESEVDPGRRPSPNTDQISSRVRINRVKVSASKSSLTSIRRPSANTTSKEQMPGPLPLRWIPATFTSTNRLPSPCPSTSIRRLLSPRCNVPSAQLCL